MSTNKLILLGAALMLAWLLGATPASAQVSPACDPTNPDYAILDCDGDLVLNGVDQCPFHHNSLVVDPNDCDGDGVLNATDICPFTVLPATFSFGNTTCNISGLDDVSPSTGCSLAEVLEASLDACDDNPRNHGKFVSCVAKGTNLLKKQKVISGAQKGQIQSCAAQTDIGK